MVTSEAKCISSRGINIILIMKVQFSSTVTVMNPGVFSVHQPVTILPKAILGNLCVITILNSSFGWPGLAYDQHTMWGCLRTPHSPPTEIQRSFELLTARETTHSRFETPALKVIRLISSTSSCSPAGKYLRTVVVH